MHNVFSANFKLIRDDPHNHLSSESSRDTHRLPHYPKWHDRRKLLWSPTGQRSWAWIPTLSSHFDWYCNDTGCFPWVLCF